MNTESITHADFVSGVRNGTVGFRVVGEPYKLVSGARRTIFFILVMLYTITPLVIIPYWAYLESNWWLLIGILISYGSSFLATWERKGNKIGAFLLLASLVSFLSFGIHSVVTFLSLSAFWGNMFYHIAESAQNEYAMQSLVESPELFNRSIAQGTVIIVEKDA